MIRRLALLTLASVLPPAAASAQQGTVEYDRTRQYDFQMPETLPEQFRSQIATQEVTPMVMHFTASEWVILPEAVEAAPPQVRGDRIAGLTTRLKMGSLSRGDHESFLQTYVSAEEGTVTETRKFMDRTFLISGPQPSFAWSLTAEEGEFLGYRIQKATAVQDSTTIEAWFTPQIPVSAGPGPYGGLPGLILVVSVNDGHLQYAATEVSLAPLEQGAIRAPEDGDKVTPEEYEEIVTEKMDELRTQRRRRRGGGLR